MSQRQQQKKREAAQRRVEEKKVQREKWAEREARLRDLGAKRRDYDIDQPFYLNVNPSSTPSARLDPMPSIIRGHRSSKSQ